MVCTSWKLASSDVELLARVIVIVSRGLECGSLSTKWVRTSWRRWLLFVFAEDHERVRQCELRVLHLERDVRVLALFELIVRALDREYALLCLAFLAVKFEHLRERNERLLGLLALLV